MKEFQKWMTRYPNGCKIDHLPQRSVSIIKHPKDGLIIELRRQDVTKKELQHPPAIFRIEPDNVELTGVRISVEAGMALFAALHDYFTRIEKAENFLQ